MTAWAGAAYNNRSTDRKSKTRGQTIWQDHGHNLLWWGLLIPLLVILLLVGGYAITVHPRDYPFILAVGAFSIAYALHCFSVSVCLCGVYVHQGFDEDKESKYEELRALEFQVVTSAMLILAGGLVVVLAGGLAAIGKDYCTWVYSSGAILYLFGVCKYVCRERRWPRRVRRIIQGQRTCAE